MTMGKASRRLAKKQHQQHQLQAKQEIEALRQQMRSCYEQQDYAGTINTLAAIVQAGAHDADDLYLGAYSYFMMGDYERTAKMVTTVLDLAPGHLEARLLLARLCIFQNRIDDGLAIYDFVLESYANALTEEQSEDIEDILDYYGRQDREHIAEDFPHVAAFLGLTEEEPAAQPVQAAAAAGPASQEPVPQPPAQPVQSQAAVPARPARQEQAEEPFAVAPATQAPAAPAMQSPAAPAQATVPQPQQAASVAAQAPADAVVGTKIDNVLGQAISLREKLRVLNAYAGGLFVADDLAGAEQCLRACLTIDEQDAPTLRNLAVLLHAAGQQDKAFAVAAQLPCTDFLLLDHLRH